MERSGTGKFCELEAVRRSNTVYKATNTTTIILYKNGFPQKNSAGKRINPGNFTLLKIPTPRFQGVKEIFKAKVLYL